MKEKKTFNVRMDKDLWSFLKKKGIDKEISLNGMIIYLASQYKKKCDKRLTDSDAMV